MLEIQNSTSKTTLCRSQFQGLQEDVQKKVALMRQAGQQSITVTFHSLKLLLWLSPRAQWNWLTEATLLGRIP